MFSKPAEILKAREGTLAEVPFPLLIHALLAEERTCTLELKVRALEKRIDFEDGSPVACRSNLLHETLGKFLVEKGKLTEAQYQTALTDSVQSGTKMGELLVQRSLISPFDLYRQMQANLALKILDCFRWQEARYRILADDGPPESAMKMNTARLVWTGASNFAPFEVVATHLMFADDQRFALVPSAAHEVDDLKLNPKELRLLQLLKKRPTFNELQAGTQLDTESTMRRLFAFGVLGIVNFAEAVSETPAAPAAPAPSPVVAPVHAPTPVFAPAKAPVAAPPPVAAAPAPAAQAPAPAAAPVEESEEIKNALAKEYLEHRAKDPFDLLAVPTDVQPLALKKAFVAKVEKLGPHRFRSADLREKAEMLLMAYARAFSSLADPEQIQLCRKRRSAAEEKAKGTVRPTAAEQFRIRTDLLDAKSQFDEGKRRLADHNFRGALEFFQYACDIEPKAIFRAHLGWARYMCDPGRHGKLALQDLGEAARVDPNCEEAHFWAGEINRALNDLDAAEEAYKKAFKANPRERKYADLVHEVVKLKKQAR